MRRFAPLLVGLAFAACGDAKSPTPSGPAPVPQAALDALRRESATRANDDPDGEKPRAEAIEEVARDGGRGRGEARQAVLTAWLTLEIDGGRVEEAEKAYRALVEEYDGVGRDAGRGTLPRDALAGGLYESAVEQARRRIEGSNPDLVSARSALGVADALAKEAEEPDLAQLGTRGRAWVERTTLADLVGRVETHDGPRVVALLDDFLLGDTVIASVLERWSKEGADSGLRVGVLPILRGHVREGIRRVRVDTARERAHIAARFGKNAVHLEPGVFTDAEAAAWGVPSGEGAVLLTDRTGRVVARVCSRNPDPRALDEAVQRVLGR
jgi:hypothetical protein